MSRCHIIAVKPDGSTEHFAEARNARDFYVHIWTWLAEEHGFSPIGVHDRGAYHDPGIDRLWKEIRALPAGDRLALAAAFDRCWIPRSRFGDLLTELRRIGGGNLWEVAHHVERLASTDAIGVGFDSSISNAWYDHENDGLRRIDNPRVHCADEYFAVDEGETQR